VCVCVCARVCVRVRACVYMYTYKRTMWYTTVMKSCKFVPFTSYLCLRFSRYIKKNHHKTASHDIWILRNWHIFFLEDGIWVPNHVGETYLRYVLIILCAFLLTVFVLRVLLSSYVYFFILFVFVLPYMYLLYLMCICCTMCVLLFYFRCRTAG